MNKKTAIVFGGFGGIGSTIVEKLFHNGYEVSRAPSSEVNVTKVAEVQKYIQGFSFIDVVVYSVGRPFTNLIELTEKEERSRALDLYVNGLANVVKFVLPMMRERRSGYIINIGGLRSFSPAISKSTYCLAKAAATMFMKVLQLEVESNGIKATTIQPGFTNTPFYREKSKRPYHKVFEEWIPSDITQPEDIANAVAFLLSLSPGAFIDELCMGRCFSFSNIERRLVPRSLE